MNNKSIIVSDTGPLITLCSLNRLQILNDLYGDVYIPEAVYTELNKEKYPKEVEMVDDCPFIHVKKVLNTTEVSRLLSLDLELHKGESEAIVLTEELMGNERFLIIDDMKARTYAEAIGINTIGAIGVISTAIREGLIGANEVETCIAEMKRSHRYYSELLYDGLRRVAEDYKNNNLVSNKCIDIKKLAKRFIKEQNKNNQFKR